MTRRRVPLTCLPLGWNTPFLPNLGFESGYYGQFNRVRNVIHDMPGVTIVTYRLHEDLRLEDFSITIAVGGDRQVDLYFVDDSPQMLERDKTRLRTFIQSAIDESLTADGEGDWP